jgi:UDPglucose 6-dehydrogenase
MIDELTKAGATISAFDPEAMPNVKKLVGDKIKFSEDEYVTLTGADALLIATEWSEFRTPDFAKISSLLKSKLIFDGRNLYDLNTMKKNGFIYYSIGRETID